MTSSVIVCEKEFSIRAKATFASVLTLAAFASPTAAIGRYIDGFYNPVRRHSALDFISPLQFERWAA